jgi:hypothetical protein
MIESLHVGIAELIRATHTIVQVAPGSRTLRNYPPRRGNVRVDKLEMLVLAVPGSTSVTSIQNFAISERGDGSCLPYCPEKGRPNAGCQLQCLSRITVPIATLVRLELEKQ